MSGCLLDTTVISELRKGTKAHPNVQAWLARQSGADLYLSALTLAEIDRGIVMLRKRDAMSAAHLEAWRHRVVNQYRSLDRILDVTESVGTAWADLMGIRTLPVVDGFLAATAVAYNLVLATRNEADFKGLPVKVENPWVT
jgi:predicted nucleic acid-binding protein